MNLEELEVIITAKTAGLQSELKKVSKQLKGLEANTSQSMKNVQNSVNKATSGVAGAAKKLKTALIALGIGKVLKDSFDMARTYEASVQQVNRIFGLYSGAINAWVEKNAKTFGMARADAMKYASIYGNLVRAFEQDGSKMTYYTTELMKATTIVASSTGRTVQDVSERIRSGILGNTEAIEDLGIYAQVAMLKTSNAFKQVADGRSWDKLTFQEQQQIRVMSILEQASSQFGDSIQQNMNYSLMMLTANLKNVWLNLGQAFMPIVNSVLPMLNAMAELLERVTAKLAKFMNLLFGTNFNVGASATNTKGFDNMASSAEEAGKEAEKAGKKAKGALAGFDEVNQLNFGKDGSGSGSGSINNSLGNFTIETSQLDESEGLISEKLQNIIDSIKDTLEPFLTIDFGPLSESFESLKTAIEPITEVLFAGLKWGIDNVIYPLSEWTIEEALPSFFNLLVAALGVLNPLLEAFKPLGEWLWVNFLEPMAKWTGELIVAALKGLTNVLVDLGNWMKDHQSVVTAITISVVAFFAAWKFTQLLAFIQMSGGVVAALTSIATAIKAGIVAKIADKAETVALTLMYAKDFVTSVISSVVALGKQTAAYIANKVAVVASTVSQGAMTAATVVWNGVCATGTAVTSAFGVAMGILTSPITLVIAAIVALVAGIVLLIKNWDTVKEVGTKAWEGIKHAWDKASNWFTETITTPIANAFSNMWEGIKNGTKNAINWIIDKMNGFINGINSKLRFTLPKIMGGETIGFRIPNIPKLARGGIVDGATFMGNYIAGEAGKEMIVPLENTPFVSKLAAALGNAVMQAMQFNTGYGNSSEQPIILEIDGKEIARVMANPLQREYNRLGVVLK